MKLLIILLLLFSSSAFGESYYGFAGNCNNPIYMFDFKNQKYEAYLEVINDTIEGKKKSYTLITGKLTKIDNKKYILETTEHEPINLIRDPSEEYLWGENKEYGKHWYKPCNFKKVPELIKNAKENS